MTPHTPWLAPCALSTLVLVGLAAPVGAQPLALWAALPPGPTYCDPQGHPRPMPPLAFELPGPLDPAPDCEGGVPRAQPPAAVVASLGLERPVAMALHPDGRTCPVEVLGAIRQGRQALLLAQPSRAEPPSPAAPEHGGADCASPAGPALALLLRPQQPCAPPPPLGPLPGVLRRRIGRHSLPAFGHFVGGGRSLAAVFRRRGDAAQLAIFGEDGALRLHQAVPWRADRKGAVQPRALYPVCDLGGPGRDGLLLVGTAGAEPIYRLLAFDGHAVRAYP
ncbi:MAG: hypothetical protein RMK29_15645 [Myxococcales bacterium]|nr:hypothetical protein [Myxococcota bacterium]MDW8283149.1 hypothetical protein [Myxococcales bacterium]